MSILISSILAAASTISQPTTTDAHTLHIDPLLIVQAEEVWKYIARDDNDLWPGWDATSTPILFYIPGVQDLLINHPDPPEGFVLYEGPVRFAGASMHIRNDETHFDWDGQNTSTDINGVRTLVVADTLSNRKNNIRNLLFDSRDPAAKAETLSYDSLRADPYNQMTMIAHEAFHVHQDLFGGDKYADGSTIARYPTLSIENNVGFALEAQWLTEALRATSPGDVLDAALNWLAIRTHRRSFIPPEATAVEDGDEFGEGLAKSMEYRLLVALEGRTPGPMLHLAQGFAGFDDLQSHRDGLLKQMRTMMRGEANVNNAPYGTAPAIMRLYYSGMAIAAPLDRLAPDRQDEWKKRIFEPGTTLTQIASDLLAPDDADLRRRFDRIAATDEHAALVEIKTKLNQDGQAHIRDMVSAIEQGECTLLLIDYSALPEAKMQLSFTKFGVLPVDEHRTIYNMVQIMGRLRPETNFRQTTPSDLLLDREGRQIRFRLPESVSQEMLLSALRRTALPGDGEAVVIEELELPGVSLKLGRVTCRLADGRLELKLVK